ncbi:MAG TPA: hypothetical protein VGR90_02455, partial [Acidimicrobiales bacterium]|nr:hypothetical protein [Acidimicrobiales bacterium]
TPGPTTTCTPTATGSFSILVTVTDAVGMSSNATLNLTTVAGPSVKSFQANVHALDVGQSLDLALDVTGGAAPYTYVYSDLPPGCTSIDSPSISCSPTTAGTYPITVVVKDTWKVAVTGAINLSVNPTLRVSTLTATPTTVAPGGLLTLTTTVTGGTAPLNFVYSGLPAGCSSANRSTITCNPTGANSYSVVATVTDSVGESSSQSATVVVQAPSSGGGGGGSGTLLGLSAGLAYALIGLIVVVIVVALVVLLLRRRSGSPPPEPAPEPPADEPVEGEPPSG